MYANFNFVFQKLLYQHLKHQDNSEIQKKTGAELLPKSFDQASSSVDGDSHNLFL